MSERAGGGPIEIRLMNEYGARMPLWDDEGQTDGEELELSDALRADLQSFANRWEASVPDDVTDDRWDGVPVMSSLVSARYSLQRMLNPTAHRDPAAEDAEMLVLGEGLRSRLEHELGHNYRVTYRH
ncbi:MAG: hypothetical protein ABIR57_10995 [Aeromicrobium sp.]